MSELSEKAKGLGNEIAGNVKHAAGHLTDNDKLKAEGDLQVAKGKAQKVLGDAEGALGNKV